MKRKFLHVAFGQFVEEQLLCAHVHVKKMCKAIHMGMATYESLKKRDNRRLSDYAKILRYYYDTLTEEEFLEKTHECALRYIRYMKEREEKAEDGEK